MTVADGVSRPKLVIFDCDGVLVDSEGAHSDVVSRNLARYGLTLTADECHALFVGTRMAAIGAVAAGMGATLPDDWVEEVYGEVFVRLKEGVPVIAGIPRLLDTLDAAGIAFCVASNGSEDKMAITLGGNRILDRFEDRMFSAYTLGTWKPDPGLFLHAAAAFGVAPPDCVVVEDSQTGTIAARQAGMRCYGYAPNGDGARLAGEGATVFRDMAALPGMLGLGKG